MLGSRDGLTLPGLQAEHQLPFPAIRLGRLETPGRSGLRGFYG